MLKIKGIVWNSLTHGEKMAALDYAAWMNEKRMKKATKG